MPEHRIEITPTVDIPNYLVGEIQSRLAYVDEAILQASLPEDGSRILLSLTDAAGPNREAQIEDKVQRVVTSMVQGTLKPKVKVLEDHLERPVPNQDNPMEALLDSGAVYREGNGLYTLGPLMTRLVGYFERQIKDLAGSFNAQPHRFPTLISARDLDRVNYFRAFPHTLTFATHLREDLDVIDGFSETAQWEQDELKTPPDSFAGVEALLSPAVCYHLYFSLADKELSGGSMAATATGSCFRYESYNLQTLERLWDFTMQEVIFVGDKDFVLENRAAGRELMSEFFEAIGLAYRTESANDPFFIGEFSQQTAFQSAFQLKYEIRARIPHREGTLAIGSYNYHQSFFGRNLNITLPDGSPAHTGCIAFGLERVAYAFIAQFGLEPKKWPRIVQENW